MSTVPWTGNHHIAGKFCLCKISWKYLQTLQKKVFIFVEREVFKPHFYKWLPCLFLNTCELDTVTVTVKIDVDKAKSQAATAGYGRESTGCKYDKEPSRARSNFTRTHAVDHGSTWLTDHTNTHACVCTQWHQQNFWTGRFFCDLYFRGCQSICENQKFAPSKNFLLYGITSDSFIM